MSNKRVNPFKVKIHLLECEVEELQLKLADAEKHIDNLEVQLREQYQLVDEKDKQIEKLNKRIKKQVDNSYKIIQNCKELQIEELEKVKEYADIDYRKHCYIDAVQLDKYIDNQIKQLKGEK